MNRGRSILRLFLAVALLGAVSVAARASDRGLGLRPPTAREWQRFNAVASPTTSLAPSALARDRARREAEAARLQGRVVVQSTDLPRAVDNSVSSYFPPIRSQGSQGSCSAGASAYYYSTYTQAQDEGYDVSGGDNAHLLSPAFIYPLVNDGVDLGSSLEYAMVRLSEVGVASWADTPYSASDYTTWPTETAWVDALANRTYRPHYVDGSSATGLALLKQHLANGNVAVGSMAVHQTWYQQYPADSAGVNNGVYYAPDGGIAGGHAITFVGYDDDKTYVDGAGITHAGALLVANSWGPTWGVSNTGGGTTKGFFWVAYDLLPDTGLMTGFWYMGDTNVIYAEDRPHYRPAVYVVSGANQATRGKAALQGGLSNSTTRWWSYYPLDGGGGDDLALTDADRVAIDLTDGLSSVPLSGLVSASVRLTTFASAAEAGRLTSLDVFEDTDGDGVYLQWVATDPPVTVAPGASGVLATNLTADGAVSQISDVRTPDSLVWGEQGAASATVQNLALTTWLAADDYGLSAIGGIDRWGLAELALGTDLAPGDSVTFDFPLTAPPVTTLVYSLPVTPTATAVLAELPLELVMSHGATPLAGGVVGGHVVLSRFPDLQPGTEGEWARTAVEECAGRVPTLVQGYADGLFHPTDPVTRDQMAVFMQRAMQLSRPAYNGGFSDVPADHWAARSIQALVNAGVVTGYADGTYRPNDALSRDQLAAFIARALAGSDVGVQAVAPVTFTDVPPTYWAWRYINYACASDVVQGYADNTYRPAELVNRAQMATFLYRAFLQPSGTAVVLAGPAMTAADPSSDGITGWASLAQGGAYNPGFAYVSFDAVRLGPSLAQEAPWQVRMELRSASAPDTVASGDYALTTSLEADALSELHEAAVTSGDPYLTFYWDVASGLAAGDYLLVVSASDRYGVLQEVARRPAFTITSD